MRTFRTRTLAAVLAAVMAAAAFAGCAGGKEVEKTTAAGSETEKKASADAHPDEKKAEIYLDNNDNPYFYDSNGKKQMLIAVDYDDQMSDDAGGDLSSNTIREHYEGSNGLSFDIPDGWFAEDAYNFGTPMIYKDEGDPNATELDYNITIIPAQLMLNYDMDKDKKVDEKFIKNYFETFVKNGLYENYSINAKGEGMLGSEKADMYDITVTYKNDDGETEVEQSRTICYVTRKKNCYIAVIKVPTDDEAKAKVYTDAFEKLSGSVKLPSEEQTKKMLSMFTADPSEVFEEEEGTDLTGDDFTATIDNGTDAEDVEISTED